MLSESGARAQVAAASLNMLESMPPGAGGEPLHPQLIEEYRRRVHITSRVRDHEEDFVDRRREHFAASLQALAAGRSKLIQLHRAGEIHDSVLHSVEAELDFEELRLRQLAGEESLVP